LLARPSSQKLLAALRRCTDDALRPVVELIERHNAGLEQEALLIAALK
jgi:hypothetical protein